MILKKNINKTRKWLIIGFTSVALLLLLYGLFAWLTKSSSSVYDDDSLEEEEEQFAGARINGHEYVDLGLPSGLKWATCNIGASKPSDYGNYYAWSEPLTTAENSHTPGMSESELKSSGIINTDGNLTMSYDVARATWGGSWRMPTYAESEELINECQWEWTSQDGYKGCRVTGPNGNSIFLPAAGLQYETSIYLAGESGVYWSSTYYGGSSNAYGLGFNSRDIDVGCYSCSRGFSVRPVAD